MNGLDWFVVIVYILAMIWMSYYLGKKQKDMNSYYLGGNNLSWWSIGISTMATQCSTNSLLGAPAFIIVTGMLWLQYEFAVPLAMVVIMIFLLPFYRKLNLVSVYEYLESRFGIGTRTTLSIMFQFLRAFATGVTVFGISLVLEQILGIPFLVCVLILGIITIIYDMLGGMEAVVYSDVIQMIILYLGILFCLIYSIDAVGGINAVITLFPQVGDTLSTHFADQNYKAKFQSFTAVDFTHHGLGDGHDYAFWPMFFGGLFLYVSYYGCDQTQVQRELSSKDCDDTNMSLMLNGFFRFPLVVTYCFLGVCIGAYIVSSSQGIEGSEKKKFLDLLPKKEKFLKITIDQKDPHTQAFKLDLQKYLKEKKYIVSDQLLIAKDKENKDQWQITDEETQQIYTVKSVEGTLKIYKKKPDFNVATPLFIIHNLPHGLIGLVIVALFAAAMSSLDSTINSLSATTIKDIYERFFVEGGQIDPDKQLLLSRIATVFWGIVCVIFAFFVGDISDSVIESINKIGSLANGPILAVFLLGILTRRANGIGATSGLLLGFLGNLCMWMFVPQVSWLWWNVIGFAVTFGMGYTISLAIGKKKEAEELTGLVYEKGMADYFEYKRNWPRNYWLMAGYTIVMIVVCIFISRL